MCSLKYLGFAYQARFEGSEKESQNKRTGQKFVERMKVSILEVDMWRRGGHQIRCFGKEEFSFHFSKDVISKLLSTE